MIAGVRLIRSKAQTDAYAMTTAKVLLTNKKGRPRKDDNILWQ